MSKCNNFGCDEEFEVYTENDCGDIVLGGIDYVILLECNHTITDPSNATQINANVASGKAVIVTNAKMSIPEASPIKVDVDVPCVPQRVVNYNRTATYRNGNVSAANITFHNNLFPGRKLGGAIFHQCAADKVTWVDEVISITGSRTIPDNNNATQAFVATFEWLSLYDSMDYNAPAL